MTPQRRIAFRYGQFFEIHCSIQVIGQKLDCSCHIVVQSQPIPLSNATSGLASLAIMFRVTLNPTRGPPIKFRGLRFV